jgi:hypothetical protein
MINEWRDTGDPSFKYMYLNTFEDELTSAGLLRQRFVRPIPASIHVNWGWAASFSGQSERADNASLITASMDW